MLFCHVSWFSNSWGSIPMNLTTIISSMVILTTVEKKNLYSNNSFDISSTWLKHLDVTLCFDQLWNNESRGKPTRKDMKWLDALLKKILVFGKLTSWFLVINQKVRDFEQLLIHKVFRTSHFLYFLHFLQRSTQIVYTTMKFKNALYKLNILDICLFTKECFFYIILVDVLYNIYDSNFYFRS